MEKQYLLSVVVPAYNEEDVLGQFYQRITAVLDDIDMAAEIVFVNDGSSDQTYSLLCDLRRVDERVAIVNLSRNFGKEVALTAGLHKAGGDAVIVIDADLQDPPELIPQFISEWQNGYDVIYATRRRRAGESMFKKTTAHAFYRFMKMIGDVQLPADTGDYRLLSRRAVDALNTLGERHRFMKGLFTWIGFKQKSILYDRDPRLAGETKWNYWKLWNLAIEGITSFTTVPLKFATYIGFLVAFAAFIYGSIMILKTLIFGNPVAGYPSLVAIILFFGGVQLMAIGLLGEYIGRIFTETKKRPLYFVSDYLPSKISAEKNDQAVG